MEKIVKDVGDIQSRLIDHRPVLQGEIRYFIREECRLLENLNKMTSYTNEHDLPRCTESMHEKLCDALTRLEAVNHMAQRIQQRELEAEQNSTGFHSLTILCLLLFFSNFLMQHKYKHHCKSTNKYNQKYKAELIYKVLFFF
uniref:Biogenesis of lysosome-related organelles complex 1 subunit 5 n=1 Tax=Sinocyclocheilus anshuiensis TaxID=1608454 RepID=A0A671KPR0_9TELE